MKITNGICWTCAADASPIAHSALRQRNNHSMQHENGNNVFFFFISLHSHSENLWCSVLVTGIQAIYGKSLLYATVYFSVDLGTSSKLSLQTQTHQDSNGAL